MQTESSTKLLEFIHASKSKGASDEFLTALLQRRGWPLDDVYAALGQYWENCTGHPVPERAGAGESSRDAFLYLLSFATLATWASSLGSMLFQFINHWFPDPVSPAYAGPLRHAVTWQMASIAVAFPIYLLVMRTIFGEARSQPERLQSQVRKWLTYIALLATAGGMIGDLICFLDYFLTGELSSRFLLKTIAVMFICGGIFVFYFAWLRLASPSRTHQIDSPRAKSLPRAFAAISSSAVVTCFFIGLGLAGTPSKQREIQADQTRVRDLQTLASAIKAWNYRAQTAHPGRLMPASLADLKEPGATIAVSTTDPLTNVPYQYRITSATGFELCATFATDDRVPDSNRDLSSESPFWRHARGRTCFALNDARSSLW